MTKKENEMEIREKLVEEIAGIVSGETSYSARDARSAMLMARVIITRIGKAYADGMPLPGEVGRGTFDKLPRAATLWRYRFIALRPSGTGKEEKKE